MTLSSLDKLTGFFSKSFFIAVILPWIVALGFNVFLAEWAFQGLTKYLTWFEGESDIFKGVFGVFAFLSFITLGMLTKPIMPLLWQILEGQHIPFSSRLLRTLQLDEWQQAMEQENRKNKLGAVQNKFLTLLQKKWEDTESNLKDRKATVRNRNNFLRKVEECEQILEVLKNRFLDFQASKNDGEILAAYVNKFIDKSNTLEQCFDRKNEVQGNKIDRLCREFSYVMTSINHALKFHLIEETLEYGDNFPREHKGVTRFANIGQATRSHIFACYGIDSRFFWSRFIALLGDGSKSLAPYVLIKSHLDFLILSIFLIIFSTLMWTVILFNIGNDPEVIWVFTLMVLFSPFVIRLMYFLALKSREELGTSIRTIVDLKRHELLTALHAPIPENLIEERQLWTDLLHRFAYAEHGDFEYLTERKSYE